MATFREIKRKSGIRHVAQVYLGTDPATDAPKNENKSFRTLKDAEQWARSIEVKKDKGTYRPTITKSTFAHYLRDTWLPFYASQVRSTYNAEKVLGKWIINAEPKLGVPLLGRVPLRTLTAQEFTKLYLALADEKRERPMQYRGIQHLHGLIRRALKYAVEQGELPANPTDFAKLPKADAGAREITSEADEEDASEVESLSRDQAKRFLVAASKDRFSMLWLLLFNAALRPGEAFALKWRHIDDHRGVVKVRGSLTRVRNEQRKEKGQGWMVTNPKTKGSKDDVPVVDNTLAALKHWKAAQNEQRLLVGPEWRDDGFIFTTGYGAPLGNNVRRSWIQVMREADGGRGDLGTWGPEPTKPRSGPTPERSFTPHFSMYVLRHTRLTFMYEDTGDILLVSRFARHKNVGITSRFYVHTKTEQTKPRADESFNRLVASAGS
jgi:integrase